ncbi:MAG TPA: cytochrome P450 [Thermomicrobiaceae bacterium]|nr:cytochrome P450 [Thermomicrobiaceae bacterium]
MSTVDRKLDPFPWYRAMRHDAPVVQDPEYGNWSVFRYDDVLRVLSDWESFSSQYMGGAQNPNNPIGSSLIGTDPPRHRQLRSLVNLAFTPRAVAALEPRIVEIADDLLGNVSGAAGFDLVGDLAYPLPVTVIADLLGVAHEHRETFKRWADAIVSEHTDPQERALQGQMIALLRRSIAEHRAAPRDDLISALLAAQVDGEHLSEVDLLGFCMLLLVAGHETTTNLIGNAILCFDEQPGLWQTLRAERTLLPGAIEEALRYRSPVQSMFRVAARDVALDGHRIPAGQMVTAWIGSANRDPAQFPDPERFDVRRRPNRHLAFGHGIHFCLGAPLARLEARVTLSALLDRYAALRVDRRVPLEPMPSQIVYGVRALPVLVEPA